MKKNTLIRTEKAHSVKLSDGSNVAQRKSPAKASDLDIAVQTPSNIQKVVPTKTPKIQRITTPTVAVKTVRTKAQISRPVEAPMKSAKPQAAPVKVAKPKPKPKPKPRNSAPKNSVPTQAPATIEPLWEQDNPIKARIEQLKIRNAQLAEQLQRLPQTSTARGK